MARQDPKRVDRLVLSSIGIKASMRSRLIVKSWLTVIQEGGLAAMVEAAMPHVFGEAYLVRHQKHLDRIAKTIVRRNREASVRAHLAALGSYPGLRSMLHPLDRPLLVMCGADDPLVSANGAAEVAERSGGRHMVVKTAGHSIPAEVPELFLETIHRFLTDRWTGMPEGL
jgi:pimeloyl-ACP methyl ester carboxylesterase